ncbi:MAG: hypothetical protein R3A46_10875 [Thermomicrobiales bacterium]
MIDLDGMGRSFRCARSDCRYDDASIISLEWRDLSVILYLSCHAIHETDNVMGKLLLWLILLVLSWPLALLALVLYPVVWLLTLPFRLLGFSLSVIFEFIGAVIRFPARLLRGPQRS